MFCLLKIYLFEKQKFDINQLMLKKVLKHVWQLTISTSNASLEVPLLHSCVGSEKFWFSYLKAPGCIFQKYSKILLFLKCYFCVFYFTFQTNLKETRNKTFFDCEIYWNLQQYKDCSAHRHTLYWPSKILAMKTFFRQVWGWQFTHKFCKYF